MRWRILYYIPTSFISALNIIFFSFHFSKLFAATFGEGEPEICWISVVYLTPAVIATIDIQPGTATETLLWLFTKASCQQ